MHKYTQKFYEFCLDNLEIDDEEMYKYKSLPICIIDCVYSLRAKYYEVTKPIVLRYANKYLDGDIYNENDNISTFLKHLDECGLEEFADKVVCNHQLSGNNPKANICYKLAKYFKLLHIETIEDFKNFESEELLTIVIKSVKGIKEAGCNYLFMLAGDENKCKPDIHIHRCIKDACGSDVTDLECQTIFTEVVDLLHDKYPRLTVRKLDSIIWELYQSKIRK